MKKLILLLLITFSLNSFSQIKEVVWETDINKAIEKSLDTKKPILFFFTGKDWCPPCKMTQKNVFESKEFAKWSTKIIPVELDFPRGPKQKDIPIEYMELARALSVNSYPTMWFIDVELKDNKPQLKKIDKMVGGQQNPIIWINNAENILQSK
ncbi:MAG: hypothetical protein CMD02_01425 [Flavobacteriales bacterium]|nr:hypothetical protein [Flavobacteriales bacterium]|tara:strand:- start:1481 stop:1939 length:459 start_codon:yes stop_codon:yes gene_type:complete